MEGLGGVFRKKPVEIKAWRTNAAMSIETLEGTLTAKPGDWIITGVKGEQYPCKDDIFRQTYEPVDDAATAEWNSAYAGPV